MKYSTVSYLMHHGVLGQKWGVRRWQNEDGSLTPEGRVHYGIGEDRIAEFKNIRTGVKGNARAKQNFIDAAQRKIYADYDGETAFKEKYSKRWDKEHKGMTDEEIEDEYGFGDLERLKNEGYGNNIKEVAKEWDWEHQDPDEYWEYEDWRAKNRPNYDDKYVKQAEAEVKKVADEIFGSDEMIAKANKGKKIAERVLLIGGGTLVGAGIIGGGIMAIKNRTSSEKSESPDLDETLRSEAKKRGVSDEEFNRITKPNNTQKEKADMSEKEWISLNIKVVDDHLDKNNRWEDKRNVTEAIGSLAYTDRDNLTSVKAVVNHIANDRGYELFEPHNGKKLASETKPKEEWDDDTFTRAVFNLKNNFSKENYEDLDRISEQVYRKKR